MNNENKKNNEVMTDEQFEIDYNEKVNEVLIKLDNILDELKNKYNVTDEQIENYLLKSKSDKNKSRSLNTDEITRRERRSNREKRG